MEESTTLLFEMEKSEASIWGDSNNITHRTFEDIKMDSNFAMLLCSLVFAVSWVVYITYYNSRIFGFIITKIVNRLFIKEGYFKIGSLSLNALSGKIMFRDVVYITYDYTVRVQDGYLIFRWWRSYVPKDVSEDLSHSDTRLSLVLIGFELHMYNRSDFYAKLEEIFGLGSSIVPEKVNVKEVNTLNVSESNAENSSIRKQRPEAAMARTWRDLIPVIKCDVSSSRVVFGNRLIPTTLSISCEESHFLYSTKPAVCTLDRFMHFVKAKAENVKLMLAPSLKYTGMLDEPPRYMGEGFVLMQSNDLEIYFYMDDPGLVPEEPVLVTLPNGDVVASSAPKWGVDIKCGKSTNFSYGPWADRQREHLFKFFYPQDYLPMEVTKTPKPGDKRQMESFDIRLLLQNDSTIDILFTKDKETNAIHINVGAGSYLEVTIPWVTKKNGYITRLNGQLLHVEATTSLQYRDFVESETLEFCLECHYPLVWNDHQLWKMNLTGCKVTLHLIFYHKWFFQDLINDWSSKQRPDIVHFVPYTWRFGLTLKHSELLTLVNRCNWIDCSSVGQRSRLENTQLGLCAHFLHLSFDLPFDEFLPETIVLNFGIQGESIDLSLFIPEFHTSRDIVRSLQKHAKMLSKDGSTTKKAEVIPKWRNVCKESDGWVDFWWVPIGAINIAYTYHPCPPLGPQPQADISTPDKEEILLSPMRFSNYRKNRKRSPEGVYKLDPTILKSDMVNVELEIGPSVLQLYGTALKNFMNFKENIFGEDQVFTDMQQSNQDSGGGTELKSEESSLNLPLELREDFDQRNYRPLEVDVSIVMHDIQAHLLKNCTEKDPPCPVILIERFGFEMKKRYDQTELQLLLSPAVLLVSDNVNRAAKDRHLGQGKLTLSSLQIRGHAMFSDVGVPLDQDTLEYAWLVEIQLGKLSGKLSTPQLYSILACLETIILLLVDDENELISPKEDKLIMSQLEQKKSIASPQNILSHQQFFQQLLQPKNSCSSVLNKNQQTNNMQSQKNIQMVSKNNLKIEVEKKKTEDSDKKTASVTNVTAAAAATVATSTQSEDGLDGYDVHKLKYKFCRVAIDAIDFWLVEGGTALQLWMSPVRLASCNLHGKQVNSGLSSIVYSMSLRQLIWQQQKYNHKNNTEYSDLWLEVGSLNFGPLIVESAMSLDAKDQNIHTVQQKFLKMHDDRLKKLWFLWPELNKVAGKCGCTGGCTFFGSNSNGSRFFRPSKKDLEDGINVAAFRINEIGKDPGYGQSILHDGLLIFRTTPYTINEIFLQDTTRRSTKTRSHPTVTKQPSETARVLTIERERSIDLDRTSPMMVSSVDRRTTNSRRFSSSSIRSAVLREVPYARLIDSATGCSNVLPIKLDSDSKLHTEKGKLAVNAEVIEPIPKNSVSDSKLAVDYFNAPTLGHNVDIFSNKSAPGDETVSPQLTIRSLDDSDSQHSLGMRNNSFDEKLDLQHQLNVQRTTSMSSENHSEAFFSAEEDLNLNSRSSSLRYSIQSADSNGGTLVRQEKPLTSSSAVTAPVSIASAQSAKKKYSSELSIATDRSNARNSIRGAIRTAPGSAPGTTPTRLSTHRSDHEIHTPEHRSFARNRETDELQLNVHGLITPQRNRSISPRIVPTATATAATSTSEPFENGTAAAVETSSGSIVDSSDTYSNASYASAVGSQEDFTLVDLHRQANRLIVDSPMLMSSYVTHLGQVKCANWGQNSASHHGQVDQFSMSLFERNEDSKLVYSGGRFVPYMETITDGVTSLKMVSRCENGNKTPTSPFVYHEDREDNEQDNGLVQEEELIGQQRNAGSRTTIIVKLKGDLDLMLSPLLLESLQRFVDSLTTTVANLHPLTVINHLHTSCVSQVESSNGLQSTENIAKLCQTVQDGNVLENKDVCRYEETIKTQLQAAVHFPKVNVTFLQVSIVEEIISFSALDNIKDLTCVSLFTVCFDGVTVKLHCDKQANEVLQKFHRPAVVQTGRKKGSNKTRLPWILSSNTNADTIQGEPVYIESCEKLQQQLVVCLNIGKIHSQLRRLRNESSILDDAVITAIPSYKSKVLFTSAKMAPLHYGIEYYLQPPTNDDKNNPIEDDTSEDKLGFIMFECGLEGISLKVVKKSHFEADSKQDASNEFYAESVKSHDDFEGSEATKSVNATPKIGEHKIGVQAAGQRPQSSHPQTPRSTERNSKDGKVGGARNTTPKNEKSENSTLDNKEVQTCTKDTGNVSSCCIDLKMVWFNFAAPPTAPITRKIDYTRLDWNLLSTASPAINAWMNPSNRLAIRVVHLVRVMYRRSTAIVACLMAESLDKQSVHELPKSRYGKLSPLSQVLQNDPSLQLCTILQTHCLDVGTNAVEINLREPEVPQLFALRQGVIVLSRQWKKILCTPLLPQHTRKERVNKPYIFPVSLPEVAEVKPGGGQVNITIEHPSGSSSRENIDATTSPRTSAEAPAEHAHHVSAGLVSPTPTVPQRRRKSKNALQQPVAATGSGGSIVLPMMNNGNLLSPKRGHLEDNTGSGVLRDDRTILNLGSDPSDIGTHSSPDLPSSPLHRNIGHKHISEDMYSWMAKQDEVEEYPPQLEGCLEAKFNTLPAESSGEPGTLPRESQATPGISLVPVHDSGRLLDANQVFQPLLSALGIMPQQLKYITMSESNNEVTTLDALGSNFCLVGNMDTMRIDISESEAEHRPEKKKGKTKTKKPYLDILNIMDESPSFVCEKISVDIEIERMTDMDVNEMMKADNVFYISRGQIKNHTSTVINFTIGVHFISQRVNMPLLRLLHQITNMYQNVKDARNELHEQQPLDIKRPKNSVGDLKNAKHNSSTSVLNDSTHPIDPSNKLTLKISDAGSLTSQQKAVSPSPSLRLRPQSFAQKLISTTSKSVRGYVNLNEGVGTPVTLSSPSGSALEHITVSSDKSTGRCWKIMYHLSDLYSNMPDTKTFGHGHRFSLGNTDPSEHYKGTMSSSSHTKLVVFGVARIHRTKLLATLSGLKLEAEITSLHSSLTCRKRSSPAMLEYSITGQVGRTMIVLLEGATPNLQTVVKVTIGKSQTLYSSVTRRSKDKNAGLLTIGAVNIDIPQHPVALHGMVTRGSKQLSSTLQELRVTRTASRMSRGGAQVDEDPTVSPSHGVQIEYVTMPAGYPKPTVVEQSLLQPLVMQFSVILQSFSITAALLPSLQAQYKMDQVNSTGFTGSKAKFTIDLKEHSLSFTTKLQGFNSNQNEKEANLPSEASIDLPKIHVSAEYIPENATPGQRGPEGVVFRPGGYLNAQADIGIFKHSLTTDLLNHLVFVQKVFMKEVNEVVQKVYGGEKPVPIWLEDTEESSSLTRILFSLVIKIQGIELTATTAGSSAVRLETGEVVFELSNRIQNVSGATQNSTAAKLFGKAQIDLKLSLGQIIRNAIFEEAEIEFQPVAFFNTRIGLRNAFQDEIVEGEDKEVVLLTLKRPLVYIQPAAVDKAILVWLNYKNAYDYWYQKRANLNEEFLSTTLPVYEKFQLGQLTSQLGTPHLGTLFMQLTVEDMGICVPLNPLPLAWSQRNFYEDSRGAVVVTLENTSISACSSGSLVSKGKFSNLCLRFADDFENSFDDWKPDMNDSSIMNLCVVSDGTYEVCSRTIAAKQPNENAKWFLNVQWQMEGVDIHLDTNIGKQLSALGHTLTMLTGIEDSPFSVDYDSDDNEPLDGTRASQESILKTLANSQHLDNKSRSKLIEKAMNEQAKIISDLRSLGASHGTIEDELKRLHELEALVYKDFRRDMIQKLRRQSVRASSIKGKFGLGGRRSAFRSSSFVTPNPVTEQTTDSQANLTNAGGSLESSPNSGPSRSSSLRIKHSEGGPRVTFSEQPTCRKSSLPSASSDLSLPESQIDWVDELDIDGQKVPLRKKLSTSQDSSTLLDSFDVNDSLTSSQFGNTSAVSKSQEPNVDLELDVKVFINSGKCVLHTKDPVREEEIKLTRMKKDRSCSAGILDFPSSSSSPDALRKHKEKHLAQMSTSRLRNTPHGTLVELTIFHIPGMDVKLHYFSKVLFDDSITDGASQPPDFDKAFGPTPSNNPCSFGDGFPSNASQFTSSPSPPLHFDETDEIRIDRAFKRQESQPSERNFTDFTTEIRTSSSMHGITNPNYGRSPPTSTKTSLDSLQFDAGGVTPPPSLQDFKLNNVSGVAARKPGIKKASLFAWMTLQSVPEETIISPHILEFLEQALEPIPAKTTFSTADNSLLSNEDINYGNYVYASFPVDVIVYFHMQPTTFRFSCLPVSRVECLLQLPSLDIIFSSKRAEDELFSEFGNDGAPNTAATAVGGLSVTGCLSDFSVYIFHPYGGKKSMKEAQWSPLSDSERKDSLSINVEFVKFHLSRSRMLNFKQETSIKGKPSTDQSRAVIRFSTIVDIGSASFKYDMRRLTEILAFPKAWYRRSIVRRMFLGDLSMSIHTEEGDSVLKNSSPNTQRSHENRSSKSEKSPLLNTKDRQKTIDVESHRHSKLKDVGKGFSTDSGQFGNMTTGSEHKNTTAWETLVVFAVNFKKLNVHMNMGNVMGNVSWLTRDFRSDGRLSIGSTGHKNLYIALGLSGSGLDAKGGIVGGNIEIANIDTFIHIREEPNVEPDHTVGVRLHALELRLDYMATSVLMCRVSDLKVNLRDEWKLNSAALRDSFIPTRRPAIIFMHGDLGWDQLQMMISKSTTADLLKMFNKLEEFFSQQFNSSKRAFSGFAGSRPPRLTSQKIVKETASSHQQSTSTDARHHRHWQRVLATVAGLNLNTMRLPLPPSGTVLGGTMELHGNNISLACFHGINFKSKSWALFSLKEPCITFNTEAQEIPSTSSDGVSTLDVHVVQTLTCSLGLSTYKTQTSMATVCKVSRSVIFPPQFKSLQEWFNYAFANSQIDEVDRFPSLERGRTETNSIERGSRGSTASQKLVDHSHTREVIFALPSLQLHLKTEHLQTAGIPDLSGEKPFVECSFITEFEDHIFVTVDAEAFFFLHDLITSYVQEKQKVLGGLERRGTTDQDKTKPPNLKDQIVKKGSIDGDIFAKDWRDYNCKTWHLEPTVRLLSVAGKYIEPYGIDYILQKLGFSHARTTIPKWMQRGFMDPLDATLAVLTLKMVQVVREDNKNEKAIETKTKNN